MPTLVLMPGFDGTGALFAPLIEAFGRTYDFKVVRYSDERTLAECVNTAASFMPDEPAVLIAESFSGPLALSLMSRFPDRVHCAVLCATFSSTPHPLLLQIASRLPAALLSASPLRETAVRMFCLNGIRDHKLLEQVTRVVKDMTPAHINRRFRILRDVDLGFDLANIRVPTLYLRASRDRLIDDALGNEVVGQLPNAILREVDGPHLLFQTKPAECAVLIREFVEQIGAGKHVGGDAVSGLEMRPLDDKRPPNN